MKDVIICGNGGLLQYVSDVSCQEEVFAEKVYTEILRRYRMTTVCVEGQFFLQ